MRLLLDEDSQGRLIERILKEANHDVLTATEAGLNSRSDIDVLARATAERRRVVTRNVKDYLMLHAAMPAHCGILVEHQEAEPGKNMTATNIVRAIANLDASGWNLDGEFVSLNAWQFTDQSER